VIVLGPDGNLWFVENAGNKVAKVTPSGTITEYTFPTAGSKPFGIAAGPDGNLWVTENNNHEVAKVTPAGSITEYPFGFDSTFITAGPSGHLWVHLDRVPTRWSR